jgi:pimeloyl-ACP methyl ester carboxylesterase
VRAGNSGGAYIIGSDRAAEASGERPRRHRRFRLQFGEGIGPGWVGVGFGELGAHGMAAKRGPRLLGPGATKPPRRRVVEIMSRIHPDSYAQATHMLSTSDITTDLARLPAGLPIQVIVGEADVITPPAVNLELAAACPAASIQIIPGAGHALYLEKPQQFNRLLADFVAAHAVT